MSTSGPPRTTCRPTARGSAHEPALRAAGDPPRGPAVGLRPAEAVLAVGRPRLARARLADLSRAAQDGGGRPRRGRGSAARRTRPPPRLPRHRCRQPCLPRVDARADSTTSACATPPTSVRPTSRASSTEARGSSSAATSPSGRASSSSGRASCDHIEHLSNPDARPAARGHPRRGQAAHDRLQAHHLRGTRRARAGARSPGPDAASQLVDELETATP